MKTREELFIERINQKQRGAFYELFCEFYQSLVMFAMKYVREQGEAEDIVQDLFVVVWEKKEDFLLYNSFRSFLYSSVRNTCLNTLKHRKVEEKYANYSLKHEEITQNDYFDVMEEETYRQLFKVIDELPPRCREIFLLHLDNKKNEEIATALHISLLTVKTQKKKAMNYIRCKLGYMGLLLVGILC